MSRYDNSILEDREPKYGSYQANAHLIQQLKKQVRGMRGWDTLSSDKQQTIDMIFTKIGRIVTGDSNYRDSWDDIAGYAELIITEINEAEMVKEIHAHNAISETKTSKQ